MPNYFVAQKAVFDEKQEKIHVVRGKNKHAIMTTQRASEERCKVILRDIGFVACLYLLRENKAQHSNDICMLTV